MTSPTPTSDIVLWSWSGCPSHDEAVARLRSVLDELGRAEEPVEVRWVETSADADASAFVGSPTIRVRGEDVVPPAPDEPFGLTCRVYRTTDGRFSPLPDRTVLADRLRELLGP